jgi:hypothetical protein
MSKKMLTSSSPNTPLHGSRLDLSRLFGGGGGSEPKKYGHKLSLSDDESAGKNPDLPVENKETKTIVRRCSEEFHKKRKFDAQILTSGSGVCIILNDAELLVVSPKIPSETYCIYR